MFNEFFAKDTSRKIRAVNKAKGERGERLTTNVPYGYKHDSGDPKKWVIDEEAAQVVKRIFSLCMEGIPVLYADTILTNKRSQHVLEKIGFEFIKQEGDFRYYCISRRTDNA